LPQSAAWPAGLRVRDFLFDVLEKPLLHRDGRHRQPLEFGGLGIPCYEIEDAGDVTADHWIRGEKG
jgi:hypothetical protein